MDEIFIAIEGLLDLITEFILDRVFDKKKNSKKEIAIYNILHFNIKFNYCLFIDRWYLFSQRQ